MKDIAFLILSSLADGGKHGFAMQQDIEGFAGQRLGPGTLYGAISRLEDQGFIRAVHSLGRRKPYELTAAGREELQRKVATLRTAVKNAEHRLNPA